MSRQRKQTDGKHTLVDGGFNAMFGDPAGFEMPEDAVNVIFGTPEQITSGAEPRLREMTLDDIEDDCPICERMRERILAGDPPQVYAYE